MTFLLDTHTFIWAIDNDARLSEKAKTLIGNRSNSAIIHFASFWEMAIKISIGKLILNQNLRAYIRVVKQQGMMIENFKEDSILALLNLPHHHRDPFDRILIAHCQVEKIAILSADTQFDAYDITRIW